VAVGDDFTIIRADIEHLDILAPLFDAYRVFYQQPSNLEAARFFLWQRISNLESVIFLAQDKVPEQTGLGFTQLYPSFTSIGMARIWILYDLYVIPEARQKSIGRALMDRAHIFAQATGSASIELSTAIDNKPAQKLYESLGYVRDEEFYFYELPLK
jgi:ribosomal protein S18 acetylase RimI-like enzyme